MKNDAATLAELSAAATESEAESGRLTNVTTETLEKRAKVLGVKPTELLK